MKHTARRTPATDNLAANSTPIRRITCGAGLRAIRILVPGLLFCVPPIAGGLSQTNPYIDIGVNKNYARVGESLEIDVALVPASNARVEMTTDPTWGLTYHPSTFVLGAGERRSIAAEVNKTAAGIAWVHVKSPGYTDGWYAIVVDVNASLSMSSTPTLSYESSSTLTVSVNDKAGKALRLPAYLTLQLASSDGELRGPDSKWSNAISLEMLPGAQRSPPFQIRPVSRTGGVVHLEGTVTPEDQAQVLAQEEFSLPADPVWYLPVLLAIAGGLVHGIYKALRLEEQDPTKKIAALAVVIIGSAVAGMVGYFFAHLDLLGLKLDPNSLRSYPIIGFLFSYFGFEVLLPKKVPEQPQTGNIP